MSSDKKKLNKTEEGRKIMEKGKKVTLVKMRYHI